MAENEKVILSALSAVHFTNSYLTCLLYFNSLSLSLSNLHTQNQKNKEAQMLRS